MEVSEAESGKLSMIALRNDSHLRAADGCPCVKPDPKFEWKTLAKVIEPQREVWRVTSGAPGV